MTNLLQYLKCWFLVVGIIFIYLLLKVLYYPQKESFDSNNNNNNDNNINQEVENLKMDLMSMLNVSNDRIQNIKVNDESDQNSFQIEFEVLPRKLGQDQQPILSQIQEELALKVSNLDFPMIMVGESQKPLAHFDFQEIPLDEKGNQQEEAKPTENIKNKYVNPSYQPQIKYLKYLESGFHYDPEIDRTYKLNDQAKIYLEPLPTFSVASS